MDGKGAFLKKQMIADIRDASFKEEHTLASITKQILEESADNEPFLNIYFEMLMAVIR